MTLRGSELAFEGAFETAPVCEAGQRIHECSALELVLAGLALRDVAPGRIDEALDDRGVRGPLDPHPLAVLVAVAVLELAGPVLALLEPLRFLGRPRPVVGMYELGRTASDELRARVAENAPQRRVHVLEVALEV